MIRVTALLGKCACQKQIRHCAVAVKSEGIPHESQAIGLHMVGIPREHAQRVWKTGRLPPCVVWHHLPEALGLVQPWATLQHWQLGSRYWQAGQEPPKQAGVDTQMA